jgi:hypothetical protein
MKINLLPSVKILQNTFEICSTSPSNLIWKKPSSLKLKPGDFAGTKNKSGYWSVGLTNENKKLTVYMVHRIIYCMYYKANIDFIFIDHIDGNRSNNAINNLRIATNQQNACNKQKQKTCTSQYKGVSWDNKSKKWRAQICINYKKHNLGFYEIEKDAAIAYNTAAKQFHSSFAFLNHV